MPDSAIESTEVVLHELGQSVAASIAAMQQELDHYPNTLGAYLLDEVELELPVHMRVDLLGQVLTTVVEGTPSAQAGRLRLRVRPVLGACQPPVVYSNQTLEALQALSPEEIAQLARFRIYSVDDLLRVGRTAAGSGALAKLGLRTQADDLMKRAELLSVPVFPTGVADALLKIGITSVEDFVRGDPRVLAEALSRLVPIEIFGNGISAEDIEAWQREIRKAFARAHNPEEPDSDTT